MDAIGRTNDTLRTRWYRIVRFSKAVDKSITDVTEDDPYTLPSRHGKPIADSDAMQPRHGLLHNGAFEARARPNRSPADEVPTVPMTLPSGCICR